MPSVVTGLIIRQHYQRFPICYTGGVSASLLAVVTRRSKINLHKAGNGLDHKTSRIAGCYAGAKLRRSSLSPNPNDQTPLNHAKKALHVLHRLAYGPRPGDVDAVKQMGVKRYIDQQLRPESTPLSEALANQLSSLATYQLSATQLYAMAGQR